jgi:hypothetical protein
LAQNTTPFSISIPPRGYDEIGQLATHATKLTNVLAAAAEVPFDAKPMVTNNSVAQATGIPVEEIGLVLSGIATLRRLMDQWGTSADEIVGAIGLTISSEATEGWLDKNLKNWQAGADAVVAALNSVGPEHPIWLRQKARDLTYAHQNIFKSTRIITDLRPVFNTAGDSIGPMVLTHVLSIEYFDGVRNQRIEFALDENDVKELRNAAERAQVKTETTRKLFTRTEWPLIVAGDDGDATTG